MARRLNHKQTLFVKYYLIHENATKASKLAGYSEKSAGAIGAKLLQHAGIREALQAARAETYAKLDVTLENVLKEFARLGFANLADFTNIDPESGTISLDLAAVNRDQMAAVRELQINGDGTASVKLAGDKQAALDKMLRHLGGYEADNAQARPVALVSLDGMSDSEKARRVAYLLHRQSGESEHALQVPVPNRLAGTETVSAGTECPES